MGDSAVVTIALVVLLVATMLTVGTALTGAALAELLRRPVALALALAVNVIVVPAVAGREPLAVNGEALLPLASLALPDPDDSVEQARRAASVRLFTERAAAVRPGFDVDETTLPDVVRVVHGLDGMPLALELAAARLRTLSLPDLADGLSELLATLVDRSLLQLAPGTGRYRMLETIREYGADRLTDTGDLGTTRDLAAAHFTELMARHDPQLRGPGQLTAMKVISAEYDNTLAALRHPRLPRRDHPDPDLVLADVRPPLRRRLLAGRGPGGARRRADPRTRLRPSPLPAQPGGHPVGDHHRGSR